MAVNVDDSNFSQEVLQSDEPVLVDFWAQWCMPCRMIAPVIDEISREYQGRLKVCKLNVDEARGTASEYKVMSIPTLAIFKDGELVDKMVGALPKTDIIKKVETYLA